MSVLSAHFVRKIILSLLNCFCSFDKDQLIILVWVYFWLFTLFHWYTLSFSFTNTILSWLLKLHGKSWNWVVSVLQLYSSKLCWLFWVFCLLKSRVIYYYPQNSMLEFWLELCWIYRSGCKGLTSSQEVDWYHEYSPSIYFCLAFPLRNKVMRKGTIISRQEVFLKI